MNCFYKIITIILICNACITPTVQAENTFGDITLNGFQENKGQIKSLHKENITVRFAYYQEGTSVFMLNDAIAYQFSKLHYPKEYQTPNELMDTDTKMRMEKLKQNIQLETHRMDVKLVGSNPNPTIISHGKSNDYTIDYRHSAEKIYAYTDLTYKNVYPGIDWHVYTDKTGIKYDFIVHPGANPNIIQLKVSDHTNIDLSENGDLHIANTLGSITEKAPIAFQKTTVIPTRFKLKNNTIGFDIQAYNPSETLVIDPSVGWSTYYGGTGADQIISTAGDANNNIYVCGYTASTTAIAAAGHQTTYGGSTSDGFIVKFNSAGTRQWGTYYGGTAIDEIHSIAIDGSNNVYATGFTQSDNAIASSGFQNTRGGDYDAFVVKINGLGNLLWASYYGGTAADYSKSCIADASGNVYVSGYTSSSSSIASSGHQNSFGGGVDGFLVKFNASGTRQWATYYGGTGSDFVQGTCIDNNNNVFISGYTTSTTNMASGGHQNTNGGGNDGFLIKFNASGTRQWSTYYGATANDFAFGCTNDAFGNVYLSGYSLSTTNIASGGFQNTKSTNYDAFLVKFNATGTRQWGTYYGSTGSDFGRACRTDPYGNVYLAGFCSSTDLAINGPQNSYGGGSFDAFLVCFNLSGQRQWATYLGGTGDDRAYSIYCDLLGNVYLSGETQSSGSVASAGHQNTYGTNKDGFLTKYIANPPVTQLNAISCGITASDFSDLIYAVKITGATQYEWQFENTDDAYLKTYITSSSNLKLSLMDNLIPNTTYTVKVRAKVGVWGSFQNACEVTAPDVPVTQLSGTHCNTTLNDMGDWLSLIKKESAQNYEILVENVGDAYSATHQIVNNYFRMSSFPNIQLSTTYDVSVRVNIEGQWGAYGQVCSITTPNSAPAVTIKGSQCDGTVADLNTFIGSTKAIGAQDYQWNVVHVGDGIDETLIRGYNYSYMRLTEIPGTAFNKTYDIKVKVKMGDVWGDYGDVCQITTPVAKTDGKVWEDEISDLFSVYPNPNAGGDVYLNIPYIENSSSALYLTDLAGNIIYTEKMHTAYGVTPLNPAIRENLATGVYLLKLVQGAGNTHISKLVITQ